MEKLNLTRKEIIEKRQDLVGTHFEYFIDFMLNEDIPLSQYHLGNFIYLFDTPWGSRRKSEKDLAEKVDKVVKQEKFDLTKYFNLNYLRKNPEAQEKAFSIYKKVHEEFDIPFEHLFSGAYISKS